MRKPNRVLALTMAGAMMLSVAASAASYTVQSGDVLWKIAKTYGTTWQKLAEINQLKDPNKIIVGQILVVDGDAPQVVVSYKDGTYTGTASQTFEVGKVSANVSVTLKDGKISNVNVTNDPTTGAWASFVSGKDAFLKAFVGKGADASVADKVSGATNSATAVKNAVRAAVAKAKSTTTVEPIAPVVPETPVEPPKPVEPEKPATAIGKDGSYEGIGKGRNGDVVAKVTIVAGKITAVTFTHAETASFWDMTAAARETIVSKQLVQIDKVAGATLSTDGINGALKMAINKANGMEPAPEVKPEPPKVDSSLITMEEFKKEIASWKTKMQRGDGYKLGAGTWSSEMAAFENKLFAGKNSAELATWNEKFTKDSNGRPLTAAMTGADKEKYDKLTEAEKKSLADLTASATMSLTDAHGNLLEAVADAEKSAKPVTGDATYIGVGVTAVPRDLRGTAQFNVSFAAVLFDKDGKIVDVETDVFETNTKVTSYDGTRFLGWPGTVVVEGSETLMLTADRVAADYNALKTKRERGVSYGMAKSATTKLEWNVQMDNLEKNLMIGKTIPELKAWYEKNTSAVGKPLTAAMTGADKEKFDKLAEADKKFLVDLTATATLSLNDSHGDMIGAIINAFENKKPLDVADGKVASLGLGSSQVFRMGPGKSADPAETPVYSINQVYAAVALDKGGKIVASQVDCLEVATPNYDGDGMPHLTGMPGQVKYVTDLTHEGKEYTVPAPIYPDGEYRGTYVGNSGVEVLIRFKLKNGVVDGIPTYSTLVWGADNWLKTENADILAKAERYKEVLKNLEGKKPADFVNMIKEPLKFYTPVDATASATVRTAKINSALQDGLNRGVYSTKSAFDVAGTYPDGDYRGFFVTANGAEVAVRFSVKDNMIAKASLNGLRWGMDTEGKALEDKNWLAATQSAGVKDAATRYKEAVAYLVGKPVGKINDLYNSAQVVKSVDATASATVRVSKIRSAFADGLNRGLYATALETVPKSNKIYPNGDYRGTYVSGTGLPEIAFRFTLVDNKMTAITYAALTYGGVDYKKDEKMKAAFARYVESAEYLIGKDVRTSLGAAAQNPTSTHGVDAVAGATQVRVGKIVSAVQDGLNRGPYGFAK